jgi:hypothetical protein
MATRLSLQQWRAVYIVTGDYRAPVVLVWRIFMQMTGSSEGLPGKNDDARANTGIGTSVS